MTPNEYQTLALSTWANCSELSDRHLCIIGLAGEVGELAEKVKKNATHDKAVFTPEDMAKELGDIQYYLSVLAHALGYTLEEVMQMNIDKLSKRVKAGTLLSGTGDNR